MDVVGYRIKLYPTDKQKILFEECFELNNLIYNIGIDICKNYPNSEYDYKYLSSISLLEEFKNYIKDKEDLKNHLHKYSSHLVRASLRELAKANLFYRKGYNRQPTYRYKRLNKQHFGVRPDRLKIYKNKIIISEGEMHIGEIKCDNVYDNLIGNGNIQSLGDLPYRHYRNSMIHYRNGEYYLSLLIDKDITLGLIPNSNKKFIYNPEWFNKPYGDIIGIDLGCGGSNWAVDSRGFALSRPNDDKDYVYLEKLYRKFSRQLDINNKRLGKERKDRSLTKNEEETLQQINKVHARITNRKMNEIHNYCCEIASLKPSAVVMEDLQIRDLIYYEIMENGTVQKPDFAKSILSAMMYTFRETMKYICIQNNIPFFLADRNYASTQICSCCGIRHYVGKSRTFVCPSCGFIIDRDLNSAYNLRNLGYLYLTEYKKKFVTFGEIPYNRETIGVKPKPFVVFNRPINN